MQGNRIDVGAIIDSASFLWKPFGIAAMVIVIMLTDGFDLFIPSYIATALVKDWNISKADVQPFVQAGLIGMAIGSVVIGWIGDRSGRRKAYASGLALMCVGSIFCYLANNISQLLIWRLVMGLGLGGLTPMATTLVSEWTNQKMRSIVVAAVIVSIPLGGTLAGFVYRSLVPVYGWRCMFAVGAILPLALLTVFSRLLPESPKYMAKHRRLYGRLAASLNQLLKEKRFDGTEEFFVSEAGKRSANWLATILNDDFRARTVLIWTAFTANSFVLYIFTGQIPLLLDSAHLSTNTSSTALQYFSFGAIIGALGGAMLIGSFGSKCSGTLLAAAGGIASASIAFVLAAKDTSTIQLFALCLVAGASVNGVQALLYAVGTHSYPTEVRGSAVGMAQTISRVGAVVSPMVAAYYFHMDPMPSVSAFFLFMATVVVITVVSYFFIPSHIRRNTYRNDANAAARD